MMQGARKTLHLFAAGGLDYPHGRANDDDLRMKL